MRPITTNDCLHQRYHCGEYECALNRRRCYEGEAPCDDFEYDTVKLELVVKGYNLMKGIKKMMYGWYRNERRS
jgi:hypothetical protein